MGKGKYDNPAQSTDKAGMASPPPYPVAEGYPPQVQQAYPSYPQPGAPNYGAPVNYGGPQAQNTTNVVQVQPGLAGPAQPNVVIVQQTTPPAQSMAGHIAFSCVVFWCCNWLFGAIAFFLAIAGMNATTPEQAQSYGKASMWTNIAGIILTVLLIVILVAVGLTVGFGGYTGYTSASSCYYNTYGRYVCY